MDDASDLEGASSEIGPLVSKPGRFGESLKCLEGRGAPVRTSSRARLTPLGGVLAKLAEGFVAVNGFAVLQIRNSLSYQFVHLFRRVILAEVASDGVVVDRFVEELIGVG